MALFNYDYDDNASDTDSVTTEFSTATALHKDNLYAPECVLTDKRLELRDDSGEENEETRYLVKWDGYDFDRCTWEPDENLSPELIASWQITKLGIETGSKEPFDVVSWEARQDSLKEKRLRRRQRRNEKRSRRGLDPWPWPLTGGFYEYGPEHVGEFNDSRDHSSLPSSPTDSVELTGPKRSRPALEEERSDDDAPLRLTKRARAKDDRTVTEESPVSVAKRVIAAPTSRSSASLGHLSKLSASTLSNPLSSLKPAIRRNPAVQNAGGKSIRSTILGAKTKLGPNVFSDALTSTTQRIGSGSKRGGPAFHKNLSHRHAASRIKEPPPAVEPPLLDIKTGKAVPPSPSVASPLMTGPFRNIDTSKSRSTLDASQPDEDRQDRDTVASKSGLLTCWYWSTSGGCKFGNGCGFEHREGGPVARFENKLEKYQATCWYWAIAPRGCRWPASKCSWSHHLTEYMSYPDHPPAQITSEMAKKITSAHQRLYPPTDRKLLGCYFHFKTRRGCNWPEAQCSHSHSPVDWVAGMRGEKPSWLGMETGQDKSVTSSTNNSTAEPTPLRNLESTSPLRMSTEAENLPAPTLFGNHASRSPRFESSPVRKLSTPAPRTMFRIHFNFGTSERIVFARLDGLSEDMQHQLFSKDEDRRIELSQMIAAPILKSGMRAVPSPFGVAGDVLSADDDDNNDSLKEVSRALYCNNAAAVLHTTRFTLVVFPNRQDWKFLDGECGRSEAATRFLLCQLPLLAPANSSQKLQIRPQMEGPNPFSGLDTTPLFASDAQQVIFLIFPTGREDDLDHLASILAEAGATVLHSGVSGSWAHFRENISRGAVIFHEEVTSFDRIPGLGEVLKGAYGHSMYRIAPGRMIKYPGGPPGMSSPQMSRIFPSGRAVLVMDNCFTAEPDQALDVVNHVSKRISENSGYGKILGSPNLLEDLLNPPEDIDTRDRMHLANSWQQLNSLVQSALKGHDKYSVDPQHLSVYCPPERTLPGYSTMWKATDRDEERNAIHVLANWFSGWANKNVHQWRRFIVVTTVERKIRMELERLYPHLIVMVPLNFIRFEETADSNKVVKKAGDRKRTLLLTRGTSGSEPGSATSPSRAQMNTMSDTPTTPVDARLTPMTTPRSPESLKDVEPSAVAQDPRLLRRKLAQQLPGHRDPAA
ncbi:hypothetical protein FH972_022481 [Carpinus fangiana]|uniref:Chromo domain-containing protein n=1 Tax=Carpinus fangiana TaxID=176857 RepID=A0A5N6KSC8_9ROSI|nr:hypothetical protein FH972_022481 [Carpinus fangiana]